MNCINDLSNCQGNLPQIWKLARITPLFKEGKADEVNNCKPVSVLPVLSKIFERLVHDKTYNFVSNANLLNSHQSGFRKRHSTGTCLIEFFDDIYNNIEEDRLNGVLFLDLKKAFDTIDHQIAISKLSKLNMSPQVLS